jgi:hypothetical protein
MDIYEIRIVRNGQETTFQSCKQASDYAAIRHARNMADHSDHVEVWRGNRCLFTGSALQRGCRPQADGHLIQGQG